jgi:hypothetical protein
VRAATRATWRSYDSSTCPRRATHRPKLSDQVRIGHLTWPTSQGTLAHEQVSRRSLQVSSTGKWPGPTDFPASTLGRRFLGQACNWRKSTQRPEVIGEEKVVRLWFRR